MSDQRTADIILKAVDDHGFMGGDGLHIETAMTPQAAAQALYDDLLARLPEGQTCICKTLHCTCGAASFNDAIDDCKAILRAYFLVGEDGTV